MYAYMRSDTCSRYSARFFCLTPPLAFFRFFCSYQKGLTTELPSVLSNNHGLSYYFNSLLYVLHVLSMQMDGAGVVDPWRQETIDLDNPMELPEVSGDQDMLATVVFLDKVGRRL
jgi:hypothetical protein